MTTARSGVATATRSRPLRPELTAFTGRIASQPTPWFVGWDSHLKPCHPFERRRARSLSKPTGPHFGTGPIRVVVAQPERESASGHVRGGCFLRTSTFPPSHSCESPGLLRSPAPSGPIRTPIRRWSQPTSAICRRRRCSRRLSQSARSVPRPAALQIVRLQSGRPMVSFQVWVCLDHLDGRRPPLPARKCITRRVVGFPRASPIETDFSGVGG